MSFTSGRTALEHRDRPRGLERAEVWIFLAVAVSDGHDIGGKCWIVRPRRLVGLVNELDVTDGNPVFVLQRMLDPTLQLGVIHERLVPRLEINHEESKPEFADFGMAPAYAVGGQNDVALGQATDHRHVVFQVDRRAGEISCRVLQNRHLEVLRRQTNSRTNRGGPDERAIRTARYRSRRLTKSNLQRIPRGDVVGQIVLDWTINCADS